MNTAHDVLRPWFGDTPGARRKEWIVKDPAFDAGIRTRFLALHEAETPSQMNEIVRTQSRTWAPIVKASGFTGDDRIARNADGFLR